MPKVLIDIPYTVYNEVKRAVEIFGDSIEEGTVEIPINDIAQGTVLPEHHGRLIDADALECEPYLVSKGNGMYEEVKGYFNIDDAPTILEATE